MIAFLAFLAACGGDIGVIDAEQGSGNTEQQDTAAPEDTGDDSVDCDDAQEYPMGLTLVGIAPEHQVVVTAVIANDGDDPMDGTLEYGDVLYQETVAADSCGVATPFSSVELDDIGSFIDGWEYYIFVTTVANESEYYYKGTLFSEQEDAPPETPITTQWVPCGSNSCAVRTDHGVWIGIWMMP